MEIYDKRKGVLKGCAIWQRRKIAAKFAGDLADFGI